MQVFFQINEKFAISGEGATQKECWKNVAENMEPFAVGECGACKSKDIIPRYRVKDKFSYYEMVCRKCRCVLSYGQSTSNGALYPRRKYHDKHPDVKNGKVKYDSKNPTWLPNGGWEKWTKEHDEAGDE